MFQLQLMNEPDAGDIVEFPPLNGILDDDGNYLTTDQGEFLTDGEPTYGG